MNPLTMSNPRHMHRRKASEPHSYNIQAKLRNGVLSIFVHDTVLNLQWRQEFTQISFASHRLYDVAKVLIMAIQEMINNTNANQFNPNTPKPIAILVYNQWCYLTVYNSNLPSFALRPIQYEAPVSNRSSQPKPNSHPKAPPQKQPPIIIRHQKQNVTDSTLSNDKVLLKSKPIKQANVQTLAKNKQFPTRPLPALPKKRIPIPPQHIISSKASTADSSLLPPQTSLTINRITSSTSNSHVPSITGLDLDCASSSSEFEDPLTLNSDDDDIDDSDFERYNARHRGSIDSATGSIDSLFTNDGGSSLHDHRLFDEDNVRQNALLKKTVKQNRALNASAADCSSSSDEEEDFESDLFDCNFNRDKDASSSRFRSSLMWHSETNSTHKSVMESNKSLKRKQKDVVILLNGHVIDDMVSHAMDQQIAEEEYYEEEEEVPYYDPNFLGISPYYDD